MSVGVKSKAKLDVVPLTKYIGAEIRGIDLRGNPTTKPSRRSTRPGSITWC